MTNCNKRWYVRNRLHREDGPAVEWVSGTKEWWINGSRHREDGPAIENADGSKNWYLYGNIFSFNDWIKKVNMSPEEKTLLVLKYGK